MSTLADPSVESPMTPEHKLRLLHAWYAHGRWHLQRFVDGGYCLVLCRPYYLPVYFRGSTVREAITSAWENLP